MEIIQLVEYFEEDDGFYLVFEKAFGGPLLDQIRKRVHFTEQEASSIVRDLAKALSRSYRASPTLKLSRLPPRGSATSITL
jgi:serine/threonine protein kinase